MLISTMLFSGCSSTHVANDSPAPKFPPCEVVQHAAKDSSPDSLYKYLVEVVNIMLKLEDRQDEKSPRGSCELSGPDSQ